MACTFLLQEQAVLAYLEREGKRIEYFLDRRASPTKVSSQTKKQATLVRKSCERLVSFENVLFCF